MRGSRLLLVAVALAALLGGCGSSSKAGTPAAAAPPATSPTRAASGSGAVTVAIADFAYHPTTLTVKAGTEVTWANSDSAPHDVKTADSAFDTGTLTRGQSKTLTLSTPGTYTYVCSFHPFMKATVTVQR